MALEIKVYREITAYQSKPMLGMTWRQMGCVALGLPLIGGVYAACYLTGHAELGSWLTVILTVPFVAVGWIRPKGLKFERYAAYVWRYHWEAQRRFYASDLVTSVQLDNERYIRRVRHQKPPKKAVINRLETSN